MKTFPPKAVTVAKWEEEHPEFFEGLLPECSLECRCHRCFTKALDSLVAKSEATANAARDGLGKHDDLASYLVSERSTTDRQYTIQHVYWSED